MIVRGLGGFVLACQIGWGRWIAALRQNAGVR
jgi:hypothetical protein